MSERTVAIFGAGATKSCGGPLTNEILPQAFALDEVLQREDFFPTIEEFLVSNFHLPTDHGLRKPHHFPPLPLLISLIDVAIDRKQTFSKGWDTDRLVDVRRALEYVIFALLQHSLRRITSSRSRAGSARNRSHRRSSTANSSGVILSICAR